MLAFWSIYKHDKNIEESYHFYCFIYFVGGTHSISNFKLKGGEVYLIDKVILTLLLPVYMKLSKYITVLSQIIVCILIKFSQFCSHGQYLPKVFSPK